MNKLTLEPDKHDKKQIPGYDGYFADKDGNIWSEKVSFKNKNGELIKLTPSSNMRDKSLSVTLQSKEGEKRRTVHSLVLETFVCPRPYGLECCHFDGNPSNNNLSNLRWDTRKANVLDSIRHGTAYCLRNYGENCRTSKLKKVQVRVIRALKGKLLQREIAEFFDVGVPCISEIINFNSWKKA